MNRASEMISPRGKMCQWETGYGPAGNKADIETEDAPDNASGYFPPVVLDTFDEDVDMEHHGGWRKIARCQQGVFIQRMVPM